MNKLKMRGTSVRKIINLPRYLYKDLPSEYSRQRADAALKLGGREERGKERIL